MSISSPLPRRAISNCKPYDSSLSPCTFECAWGHQLATESPRRARSSSRAISHPSDSGPRVLTTSSIPWLAHGGGFKFRNALLQAAKERLQLPDVQRRSPPGETHASTARLCPFGIAVLDLVPLRSAEHLLRAVQPDVTGVQLAHGKTGSPGTGCDREESMEKRKDLMQR
jgi:hypothetical protein